MNKRLMLILVFAVNFCLQANINNLKDTLTILKPEFYEYSVIHGAVAWEKGWVMNLWDLGWDRKKADAVAGEKKDDLLNPKDAPALIRLVDRLFHRPSNTAGPMNFTPTDLIKQKNPQIIAQTTAGILAILHQYKEIGNYIKFLVDKPEVMSDIPGLNEKDAAKLKKLLVRIRNIKNYVELDNFARMFISEVKRKQYAIKNDLHGMLPKIVGLVEFYKNVEAFWRQDKDFKNPKIKQLSQFLKIFTIEDLNDFMTAYDQNPKETKLVLLALVWVCCKDNKAILAEYYKAFNGGIKTFNIESIFKNEEQSFEGWNSEVFYQKNSSEFTQALIQELKTKSESEIKNVFEENPDLYEKFVYLMLHQGMYPKLSSYKRPQLWFNEEKIKNDKGAVVDFPDCMETTMMNFILILAYNSELEQFDLNVLKSRIGVDQINPKLEKFLTGVHKHLSESGAFIIPESVEDITIHEAFSDVISNVQGTAYRCVCRNNGETGILFTKYTYIPWEPDPSIVEKLKTKGYDVVDEGDICYNLRASLANFIVVLNYLLNLNLFDPQKSTTEILRDDFIKTYFPMLADKLKVQFEPSVNVEALDAKDYGADILTRLFFEEGGPSQFTLSTRSGHGELVPEAMGGMAVESLKSIIDRMPNEITSLPSLRGLKLVGLDDTEIGAYTWIINNNINWPDLYWFNNVQSASKCTKILSGIGSKKLMVNDIVAKMLLRLADMQPDEWIRRDLYILIAGSLINPIVIDKTIKAACASITSNNSNVQSFALRLFSELVFNDNGFDEAIRAASVGISNRNKDLRELALNLFEALFEKGKGFDEAIEAASVGILNSNRDLRVSALNLFGALFEKDKGFDAAIKAASVGSSNRNQDLRWSALYLFEALFGKGKGFDEAIKVAHTGVASANPGEQRIAVKLFEYLVVYGREFDAAISVACVKIANNDFDVREMALNLFAALFRDGKGLNEAAEAASVGAKNSNPDVQISALRLFQALVPRNSGIDEAIMAASDGAKSSNPDVQRSSLRLFEILVEKDKGIDEAIKAASDGASSSVIGVQILSLGLFKILVEKDKGIDEAIKAAGASATTRDFMVQELLLEIFEILVVKNKGLDEAVKAVFVCVASYKNYPLSLVLTLLNMLFEKNKGFDEAINFANANTSSKDPAMQILVLDLFTALVEKNKAISEAGVAIRVISQDENSMLNDALQKLGDALTEKTGKRY